jgi:hypothetical protein
MLIIIIIIIIIIIRRMYVCLHVPPSVSCFCVGVAFVIVIASSYKMDAVLFNVCQLSSLF